MEYSNAQKLAVVLADWSRPAISQIATNKIVSFAPLQSIQNSIRSTGLVGQNYCIANEIKPFINNVVNTLIEPMLERYISNIPDASIPMLAHQVVDTAMQQPKFAIFDGLVEFEQNDIIELKDLLDKNLPIGEITEGYTIKR